MYEICITVNVMSKEAEATITRAKTGDVVSHVNINTNNIVWMGSGKIALVCINGIRGERETVIELSMTKDTSLVDTYCGPMSYKGYKALRASVLKYARRVADFPELSVPHFYEQLKPEVYELAQQLRYLKYEQDVKLVFSYLWHTAAQGRIGNTTVREFAA